MKFFVQDSPISTHFLQLLPFCHLFRNINTTSPFLVFRLHSGIPGLLPRRFCFRVDPSILLSFHPLVTSFLLFSFSSLRTSRSICLFFQRISQPTRLKSWTIFSVMARIDLINADRHHGWLDQGYCADVRRINFQPLFFYQPRNFFFIFQQDVFSPRLRAFVDLFKAIAFHFCSLLAFLFSLFMARNRLRENLRTWESENRVEKLTRIYKYIIRGRNVNFRTRQDSCTLDSWSINTNNK